MGKRRDTLVQRHDNLFHECWNCHSIGLKPGILNTKHGDYGMRDTFKDEKDEPGEIKLFNSKNKEIINSYKMPHNQDIFASFIKTEDLDRQIPEDINIIGIGIGGVKDYKQGLSKGLEEKLPEITTKVEGIIRS